MRATIVTAMLFVISVPAWACGPAFPNYYLLFECSVDRLTELPAEGFYEAYSRIAGVEVRQPQWRPGRSWIEDTLGADIADVRHALESRPRLEQVILRKRYRDARTATAMEHGIKMPRYRRYEKPVLEQRPHTLDLALVCQHLPAEIRLYVQGAQAYRRGDMEKAKRFWIALMRLPRSERPYRSTWAAYMLGKAHLADAPVDATRWFEKCRRLADEGFADPIGLAASSIGWQAQAEIRSKAYVAGIKRYRGICDSDIPDWESLRWAAADALGDGNTTVLIEDDVCRPILLAALESMALAEPRLSEVYNALHEAGALNPDTATRIARRLYASGMHDEARAWIEKAHAQDGVMAWIEAKLAINDDDPESAIQHLQEAVSMMPVTEEFRTTPRDYDMGIGDLTRVRSELALFHMGRKEYQEALDLTMEAGYWADSAYIAERILTTAELTSAAEAHIGNERMSDRYPGWGMRDNRPTMGEDLAHLLGRRLWRNGNADQAIFWFDRAGFEVGNALTRTLQTAESTLPRDERVRAYFDAAVMMEEHGRELRGTDLMPDWAYTNIDTFLERWWNEDGRLTQVREDAPASVVERALAPTEDERRRFEASTPEPNERHYYRYQAADLYWESAGLLPDNDARTAYVLWGGGTLLKVSDPAAADRFYKALVRRCRGLPIGQAADALRWFPDEAPPNPFEEKEGDAYVWEW